MRFLSIYNDNAIPAPVNDDAFDGNAPNDNAPDNDAPDNSAADDNAITKDTAMLLIRPGVKMRVYNVKALKITWSNDYNV